MFDLAPQRGVYIRQRGQGLLLNAVYHVRMKTLLLGLLLGIVRVTYLPVAPGKAARWGRFRHSWAACWGQLPSFRTSFRT